MGVSAALGLEPLGKLQDQRAPVATGMIDDSRQPFKIGAVTGLGDVLILRLRLDAHRAFVVNFAYDQKA
jgi:hypothetical protein